MVRAKKTDLNDAVVPQIKMMPSTKVKVEVDGGSTAVVANAVGELPSTKKSKQVTKTIKAKSGASVDLVKLIHRIDGGKKGKASTAEKAAALAAEARSGKRPVTKLLVPGASEPVTITDLAAFKPIPIIGANVEDWRTKEGLNNWDVLFALGFTSYQSFLEYLSKREEEPIDEVREILIRLYMVEPSFPFHFHPPSIRDLLDFAFNLGENPAESDRKRCVAILAEMLGRNRGSGYRWIRNNVHTKDAVALNIRRMQSKVFSMNPATARECFWRAVIATARARGTPTHVLETRLQKNGVTYD